MDVLVARRSAKRVILNSLKLDVRFVLIYGR
jgi:hypothetical protein